MQRKFPSLDYIAFVVERLQRRGWSESAQRAAIETLATRRHLPLLRG